MALDQQYDLPRIPSFQRKVEAAMITAATAVGAEAVNPQYISYHEKRSELARNVLNGPQNYVFPFAVAASGLGTLTYDSTDGDIQYVVNSIFNTMAGIRTDELPPAL